MASYIAAKPLVRLGDVELRELAAPSVATELEPLGIDGAVLDGLLSPAECASLVGAAEAAGFSFWDPAGEDDGQRRLRNAETIEFMGDTLCSSLWARLAPFVPPRVEVREGEDRHSLELDGAWVAAGLNEHLLINRYAGGGHFAPHADGSTEVSFDERSLYTVLIYLNDVGEGGATQLLRGDQSDATCADGGAAPLVAREGAVVHAVRPVAGRAVVYWHETLHAGQPVGAAECKYCLRTDVMYRRDPPLATAPADAEAYELYQRARSLEGAGDAMAALDCLRRAKRLSPLIARAYRL